jgi:transcriptional regulator GlxA family with amidase domain
MEERLDQSFPVSAVADACGLSVNHFSRAFRRSLGKPPHRWLLDRRIDRARELLRATAMSLADIALACGFAEQSHFTRVFTRTVGMPPGAWRRNVD